MRVPVFSTICVCTFFFSIQSAFAIVGGKLATQDDFFSKSTVAIVVDQSPNHDNPSTQDLNTCTGTIISPDIIVTAAHCVKYDLVGKKILFGLDVRKKGIPSRTVDGVEVEPNFKDGYAASKHIPKNNSDIAIIHFLADFLQASKKRKFCLPNINSRVTKLWRLPVTVTTNLLL